MAIPSLPCTRGVRSTCRRSCRIAILLAGSTGASQISHDYHGLLRQYTTMVAVCDDNYLDRPRMLCRDATTVKHGLRAESITVIAPGRCYRASKLFHIKILTGRRGRISTVQGIA